MVAECEPCGPLAIQNLPPPKNCCKCVCTCIRAKKPKQMKKCIYVQPEIPKSYRPNLSYEPPKVKMDDGSVYRTSYIPAYGCVEKQIIPETTLKVGTGRMSDETVNRVSYIRHKTERTLPAEVCRHDLIGHGPMQSITTQKHDYVPQPFDMRKPFTQGTNIKFSDIPLSNETTSRITYMPVDVTKNRQPPIKQPEALGLPSGKMSGTTIHKSSFLPWGALPKEPLPWVPNRCFEPPLLKMSGESIYRGSYLPGRPEPIKNYKPEVSYQPPTMKMETGSLYKHSYLPIAGQKNEVKIHECTLRPGDGRMSDETTNRMSYKPLKTERTPIYNPCHHKLSGDGPMESMTTQKYDYGPKQAERLTTLPNKNNLYTPDLPLSDKTTTRMAYGPVDVTKVATTPIHHENNLSVGDGRIDSDTTHKASFKRWDPQPPEEKPWVPKSYYEKPTERTEGNTVYRMCYDLPGQFKECPKGKTTCVDCPPSRECVEKEEEEDSCPCCCTCRMVPVH